MLEQVLSDITRRQRPYYLPTEKPIKGLNNQYWLVFKHRDAENLLHNIVSFLGIGEKHSTYKVMRLDFNDANLYEYVPKKEGNIPNSVLLRTRNSSDVEKFLDCVNVTTEKTLLAGSFLEITQRKRRRFNLPNDLEQYNKFISDYLDRTKLYRRSTAYFNSGVLKLYEEPLTNIVKNEGEIRLLMDWQGFTSRRDLETLEKLNNPDYRNQYIKQTLEDFLRDLEDKILDSTTILAELVRLDILQIKLVRMEGNKGIYHKKTGILTDHLGNNIQHDGSDNFTYSAHSKNAESVTLLYWNDKLDGIAITESIAEFEAEWADSANTFDISQDFLNSVISERRRRQEANEPRIDSFTPSEIPAGETVTVTITGDNLQDVQEITADQLTTHSIETASKETVTAIVQVEPEHPPQPIKTLTVSTTKGKYSIETEKPLKVTQPFIIPDFPEIIGFKEAVEKILAGKQGTPDDFLYYLAKERPYLWNNIKQSEGLDDFVERGILFEHQKSGAQHCQRVMNSFGVVVCADAVGLGKTRLAAAVAKLYREENIQARVAIIASKKLHDNWIREMSELGFRPSDYELYNKNLMGRKGNFLEDFNRYGGPDLVLIDEAHEGIRNYNNRIHKACLQIREKDRLDGRVRYFLLLTATPWNNRRQDIYNILSPFISKPEAFKEFGFPPEIVNWFNNRDIGVESFTDNTEIFRKTYKELFLQRTRKMLKDATPDLNFYAKRLAQWLSVTFEPETERALDEIFGQFEESLYIPSVDPIRYLTGTIEQRSLLGNQKRMFLQRAESSMYALRLTILNFSQKIKLVQDRLETVTPSGLKEFLLLHYQFETEQQRTLNFSSSDESEEEEDEEEEDDERQAKRQQLRRSIEIATAALKDNPQKAREIYNLLLEHCKLDLTRLANVEGLLVREFVKDHKRLQVMQKVAELVEQGHKVLLISVFSDTVIDYYRYMQNNPIIAQAGIGMAIGGTKQYLVDNRILNYSPHNIYKAGRETTGISRKELFSYFAPFASSSKGLFTPPNVEIAVLIGSETLSVGQNLQDANYLICIDLPWNPMVLEQRIGRIDRPKSRRVEYITIYYANSENQLLRQATRLNKLHQKLIGDLPREGGKIAQVESSHQLGPSIYGDTLFDDEILPDYIEFIQSLIKERKCEQESFQEKAYSKQETTKDIYTQNELLYSEELAKLMRRLGEDYRVNSITIGQSDNTDPTELAVFTLDYFDPNGNPIPEQQETIYWNNLTNEQDAYGLAIATAFKTPQISKSLAAKSFLKQAESLYQKLVTLKQLWQAQLDEPETLENITITSERIGKIQKRLNQEGFTLPEGINMTTIRVTLKNLNQYKNQKGVQRLLMNYTEGEKSKLPDAQFILQLVEDTNLLSLIDFDTSKAKSLTISLNALLLKLE